MKYKVLFAGVILELIYLIWMVSSSMPSWTFSLSPIALELTQHILFQIVVITIILIGAFANGKKNN